MTSSDARDNAPVHDWVEAGELLLRHARELAPPMADAQQLAVAIRAARKQLPRLSHVYDQRHVPVPDRKVVGGIVVERPTTRREAGDTLSARALARFTAGEFTTIAAALQAVMRDDPLLTKIYVAGGSS